MSFDNKLSINYKCIKCNKFESSLFDDIRRHYCRKNPCKSSLSSIFYSDDQLICLSLIPYYYDTLNVEIHEINYLKKSNIIYKNKMELFEELRYIEKNNIKTCKHCNKEFNLASELKKHLIIYCFYEYINKKIDKDKKLNNIDINGSVNNLYNCSEINTLNNTTNNNTTNNTTNNNSINIIIDPDKKNSVIPFDEEWDISKITIGDKTRFMVSQFMYTELLEEILKNSMNLNVIIDNENDSGIVYKNNIDKYISMKLKDIISNTMEKLNFHLNDINSSDENTLKEIKTYSRQIINQKYNEFKKREDIQNGVKNCMSIIYDNKKDDAKNIAQDVINDSKSKEKLNIIKI